MTENGENQKTDGQIEESGKLKPVKGKLKKILFTGTKVVIGGTAMVFIGSLLCPLKTMGMTRSARLQYEQRKSEAETAIAEEMKEDSQMVLDDE